MDRVNIVTITSCKGPAKQKADGMLLVEFIHNGEPLTKTKVIHKDSITSMEFSLQLLANAMYIVNHANTDFDSIEVYSDEQSITSAFNNKWVEKWQQDNWLTAKGTDVKHKDIWNMILELMNQSGKRFIFCKEKSSYENWMRNQMRWQIEKEGQA